MLTIFSIPKQFNGHIDVIQRNALHSWLQLRHGCEVILFGDDEGTAEVSAECGLRHVPDVSRNEYGTPLVSDVFNTAQDISRYPILCYVNADIILMSDFLRAVQQVHQKKCQFLLIGQRWDLDLGEPLDFNRPDWEETLRSSVTKYGKLHPVRGIDYFVFTSGILGDIPPFAVGRPGWDNWMVYRARYLGLPVIDATKVITAVHQNHDYSHLPMGEEDMRKGAEAKRNLEMLGGKRYSFNVQDATYVLTPDGLISAMTVKHLLRRLERIPELHPHPTPIVGTIAACRTLESALLSVGSKAKSRLKALKHK